jgi:PilZ domain
LRTPVDVRVRGQMGATAVEATEVTSGADRRQHDRFVRPLDGRRIGAIDTPVHIYDLSEGGCFITSLYHEQPGTPMQLTIHLPQDVWIAVYAETLRGGSDAGFAVRFTRMSDHARMCLMQALDILRVGEGAELHV